ncbi:reverse transcriptase domain-containing protein [Tanacetum coccineum]
MSDSEDSTVTYTEVSNPFADLSDIGSPGVDGPSVMPEDPYAYVVAAFQAPPSPDYPAYPDFMPPKDEVLPVEEQPLPVALSPTADSLGYVSESDPEEDQEEEEHLAPVDSTAVALPTVDQAPSAEETESFETDESAATPPPHLAYRITARILLAIPSPPPSPLSLWSSPLPQIPSPPLPVSPLPLPVSPTYPLGYRAAMIRLRAEALSTLHSPPPHIILSYTRADTPPSGTPLSGIPPLLPIPLPTSSPSLLLPSADHGADRPEVCLPPRKRLCFAFGPRYEVEESSSAAAARPTRGFRADYGFVATMDREIRRDLERDVGYGITDTWDEMLVDMPGAPATDDTELGRRMTEFATRVRQDTYEIYVRLDDEQTERQLMAGRLNMLYRDRRAHARTTLLMEREARMSREAWGRSMDASDLARSEVMSLRTTVLGQQAVITELQAADRRRQTTITELLAADHMRQAYILSIIGKKDQGVTAALAARDADRNTNGDDSHNSGMGVRRTERTTHEFENQVKFATCTLHSVALTWWNTHVKIVGHDVAYGVPWKTLMKMMTDKYYPQNEIKKLEMEIWDLKVKGTDLTNYTQRFQELALLCGRMFPKESDKIEKYVGGLPDMIHGSVVASKPKTMQEAVEIATELMDKKIHTFADRQTENKRKQDNNQQQQQPQNKRQNTSRAYAAGTGKKKLYGDLNPYALSAIITTMVCVLPNATSAIELAIWPVIAGVLLMPTLLITKGVLGQVRSLLTMNVVPKDILRGNVQN